MHATIFTFILVKKCFLKTRFLPLDKYSMYCFMQVYHMKSQKDFLKFAVVVCCNVEKA